MRSQQVPNKQHGLKGTIQSRYLAPEIIENIPQSSFENVPNEAMTSCSGCLCATNSIVLTYFHMWVSTKLPRSVVVLHVPHRTVPANHRVCGCEVHPVMRWPKMFVVFFSWKYMPWPIRTMVHLEEMGLIWFDQYGST